MRGSFLCDDLNFCQVNTQKHTGQYLMVFIAVVHILNNAPFLTLCSHVYLLTSLLWSCVQHELSCSTFSSHRYYTFCEILGAKKIPIDFFYTAFSWPFSLVRSSNDVYFLCCPGFVYNVIFDVEFYILSDNGYFLPV